MRDKSLGVLIVGSSLLMMVGYFLWAFAPYLSLSNVISQAISEWAFKLPVVIAVYILLVVALWIGYTMATTPPPLPIEKPLEIEREEASGLKKDDSKREN